MKYTSSILLQRIEFLRKQMTEVALAKGFTSTESIALSQELDKLLNHYQQLKVNEKKKVIGKRRG
ncbi:aspartyl-phosphate phosphatase Spo0E family protein [Aquibacillus albus]|uniref:Stage 0 sporulation regulatory protein n=1 Tax=Aquibacillus albus TaxID=1168171 RepID=A0ABS2N235_9BACI|nr:aspartyl-phosphate phosphatase Spo0E family protein [Aquibacillus albus]MBM7572202.1 stage 0 sporulation regulatory protein [Aquibacillus albus]